MNMSGHYSGQYYQPFGPPNQPFGQANQPYRQPSYPPNCPRDYNPFYPPNYPNQPPYFAEYSLWGSSSYNRLDPAELIHPAMTGPSMLQSRPRPPFPCEEFCHDEPPRPQMPPDADTQTEDEEGGSEPELSGLDEKEKKVIEKEELYKHPDNFDYFDIDDSCPDTMEQASNSSGSSAGDWTHSNFQRAGAYPSAYPWASRPARVANNRGKKANIMQRRLVRALAQPVKMDKGASMMQRMGWMGGGLGRDESGIVDPIAPNAVYATTTVGFGQEIESIKQLPSKRSNRAPCLKKQRTKKMNREHFKTNVLLHLLDFVKNDLILELYFDTKLKRDERKRIHRLVSAIEGREMGDELDTTNQQDIVNDIHRRNRYTLTTQSEGEGQARQICVYKSAPDHMFLVTPEDCRPCITDTKEVEEEPNPFLKSITKHIKEDEGGELSPAPPHLFDKLVDYYIEFCEDDAFTEFRFLGPFSKKEINVINSFFNLISDLANKRTPHYNCPVELLDVFATDYSYHAELDPNGYTSIKKVHINMKEEYEKQKEEERQQHMTEQETYNQVQTPL